MSPVLNALAQSSCVHCNSTTLPTEGTECSACKEKLPFIIDGGQAHTVRQTDGELKYLARFEVWRYDPSQARVERIDRADCLPELQAKHCVPDDRVVYWPICAELPMALVRTADAQASGRRPSAYG